MVALVTGCGRPPAERASSGPPNVAVMKTLHQEADRSITLPGDVVGFYECALHSKVTGYLQNIAVDKGDWVKKGQLLATIEVPELKENLERAKADYTIQKLTWQRLKHVREEDPKVVAQQDVDIAYSKMAQSLAGKEGGRGALHAQTLEHLGALALEFVFRERGGLGKFGDEGQQFRGKFREAGKRNHCEKRRRRGHWRR